jgi:hypothetical protein
MGRCDQADMYVDSWWQYSMLFGEGVLRRLHHPDDRLQQRALSRGRCTRRIKAPRPPV